MNKQTDCTYTQSTQARATLSGVNEAQQQMLSPRSGRSFAFLKCSGNMARMTLRGMDNVAKRNQRRWGS